MDESKLQWHPAFCYAMRLELRHERNLQFQDEFELTDKPLRIDLMVVKKQKDYKVKSKIGRIFKAHNVIEYKSPKDEMNIDTFYKTIAYACLYKTSAKNSKGIKADDLTVTLMRDSKPVKLFKELVELGYSITDTYNGIYYVSGVMFHMQIIVTSELDKEEYKWITSLKTHISRKQYLELYSSSRNLPDEKQREMADVVLQLVTSANASVINEWKESELIMCQALMDIMKPEIDEVVKKAVDEEIIKERIRTYFDCGKTPEEIAKLTNCSLEFVNSVLSKEL